MIGRCCVSFFFFNDTATTEIYTSDTRFPYTTRFRSRVARGYSGALAWLVALRPRRIVAGVALTMLACLAAIYGLARFVPSELAPAEDRGAFFVSIVGPAGAGFDSTVEQIKQVEELFAERVPCDEPVTRRYHTRVHAGAGNTDAIPTRNER